MSQPVTQENQEKDELKQWDPDFDLSHLTKDLQEAVRKVLREECAVFAKGENDIGNATDLTLRAPRVLVPTPSTKGGGVEKDPPSISRTRNATNLKPLEGLGVSFKVSKNFKLVSQLLLGNHGNHSIT